MVVTDVDSVMTCGAALAKMPKGEKYFANTVPCNTGLSSQSHCSHFQTKRGHFSVSVSEWLSWLRCYYMHGTLEVPIKAYLHPRHQHCPDEVQKAETGLSAVSYIYVNVNIYIYIFFFSFCQLNFQFFCVASVKFNTLVKSLFLIIWTIFEHLYIYIYF